jgi:hypothetical protein
MTRFLVWIVALIGLFVYFRASIHPDASSSKAAFIKQADIIAVAKVGQITCLVPPGTCASKTAYAFRANVETEYPIKGDPGKYFIMYSTGMT